MIARHEELREKIRQLTSLYDVTSAECIYEDQDQDPTGSLRIGDIRLATGKLEDDLAQVQDDLLEINLGTEESPKPIYINAGLDEGFREQLIALLMEFRDCFAWSYEEMPGLDPDIAEHKLPLKSGFRPFRQPPRRMSREVDTLIQDEIKRLEDAKFIREAQYTEWLSNIVLVMKKNGKLRVCVDFRNLNLATPKDEYPMPVADMLIDRAAGHTILSFLDAHSGYNQVPINKEDISKTAFRCPGPIGAYEWVVMPFGLKNAGATYQRAMNKMFRGLDCLETDIIKYILSKPYLRNRIGKWAIAMSEFTLVYVPQRAVKGQVLADFLADHPGITLKEETPDRVDISFFDIDVWKMLFDGSRTSQGAAELGARAISVKGDSLLVIKQVTGEFKCESELLVRYCNKAKHLIEGFQDTRIEYTERADNGVANDLAQHGSGYKVNREFDTIERETPNLHTGGITIDERQFSVYQLDVTQDWRDELLKWFEKPDATNRRLRTLALNYVVLAGELYKKGFEGLLFRCIGPKEAMLAMAEVHEGIAGAHQAGPRMRWLIHKYGFYWPKMEQDCIRYAKGCEACQKFGPIQHVPAEDLHSIIKPWPFRGWAVDLIGKVYPGSSDGHTFVIIATCYFTKWVEAKPLKSPTQEAIKMLHSTPYYAQANGQAEATNKAIKLIVQKMIEENPRQWHVFLSEAVWANRTSQKSATGTSPFRLVYGYDAMLPMELTVMSTRRRYQNELSKEDYFDKMVIDALDLDEERLTALDHLEAQKRRVERAYNKRVKRKAFTVGDIVWKAVLPIGHKDTRLGKWSPNWEGPFVVVNKLTGGAYLLADIDGEEHDRAINGQFLKKYVPSCWEGVDRWLFGADEE
ncbi:uncharacterized protein LOC126681792 [Mercurialis annua]|uniref:uncharacterized protein LOC126681792 n=1 Tax=Mercurialis annua TaxID=3986 RepID=UPI00215DEE75|nr:uncharacterized protein LOC126681792 [Mercurialis annua]